MQRKPGFPVANCSIKMPDSIPSAAENVGTEEVSDQMRQRQQLINFGHSQWGFNNWSWSLTKQDLDFVDFSNGKYAAGVAAFVSVSVRTLNIHRENVGYATSVAPMKGSAIYQARKGSVTNALKETLLSFGGNVTTDLLEFLESQRPETNDPLPLPHEQTQENNQNVINKPACDTKIINNVRKDDIREVQGQVRPHIVQAVKNIPPVAIGPPPVAKTAPLPVTLPPTANKVPLPANQPRPPPQTRLPPNPEEPKPLENMTEEEMRAERKRRQRQAQEEFRLKQMQKQTTDITETEKPNQSSTEKQDLHKAGFDTFLMEIPTQDIMIEETSDSADVEGTVKRKSPEPHSGGSCKKRPGVFRKRDII